MTQLCPPTGAPIAICSSAAIIYLGLDREVRGQLLEDRPNQQGCLVQFFQDAFLIPYVAIVELNEQRLAPSPRALLICGSPALTQQEATSAEWSRVGRSSRVEPNELEAGKRLDVHGMQLSDQSESRRRSVLEFLVVSPQQPSCLS
eukprot:s9436_g1.t1